MALAFIAACNLGIAPETVITALKSTPQIAHRLEVKPQENGSILIDDAYNSNPTGFNSALKLLNTFAQNNRRRILVTPGLVELGKEHDAEHAKLGKLAAEQVDILLAVVPERIKALTTVFTANSKPNQQLILCPTFANARNWLNQNTQPDDIILLENDLPDVYETKLKL